MTKGVFGDSLPSQKLASVISAGANPLSSYASMRGLFSRESRGNLIEGPAGTGARLGADYEFPPETLELIGNGETNGDVFNRISRYEMGLYMSNMLLRDTDVMSMASALEVRVPLLDHKLVESVYSLPGNIKTGRRAKQLLLDSLGDDLPEAITVRKKMGFALPFERWIRTSLRPFVADALTDDKAVRRSGMNPSAVVDVLARFERGARSTSWSRVWGLAVLVDWCRRHEVGLSD
jgi:asparagine synthase (glutamine-hydrolysing)